MNKDKIFGAYGEPSDQSYSYQGEFEESDDANVSDYQFNLKPFSTTAPVKATNIYDVNNPNYRIGGVTGFSSGFGNTNKYSNVVDTKMTKTNDPYSSISLSNFSKPVNKSDNYNIGIDLNKINKDEKKVEKKEVINKNEKFFDDLDNQLKSVNKIIHSEEDSYGKFDNDISEKELAHNYSIANTENEASQYGYNIPNNNFYSYHENLHSENGSEGSDKKYYSYYHGILSNSNSNIAVISNKDDISKDTSKNKSNVPSNKVSKDDTISYKIDESIKEDNLSKDKFDLDNSKSNNDYITESSKSRLENNIESSKSKHDNKNVDSISEEYKIEKSKSSDKSIPKDNHDSTITYNIDNKQSEKDDKSFDYDKFTNTLSRDNFYKPSNRNINDVKETPEKDDTEDKYNDFENDVDDINLTEENEKKNHAKDYLSSPSIDYKISEIISSHESNKKEKYVIDNKINHIEEQTSKKYFNLIKDLITNELNKQICNKTLSVQTPINENISNKDHTLIDEAKKELKNRKYRIEKAEHFLIFADYKKKILKLEKFDSLYKYNNEEFTLYTTKPKISKDINELKRENALIEERKRKDFFELLSQKQNEVIEELEKKLSKFKNIENENEETKNLNYELERKFKELDKDFDNIKIEYEAKSKLIEERVVKRESKNLSRKISEVKRRYEIEIDNIKNEMNEKLNDLNYYKNQADFLQNENSKLISVKQNNIEINEKIKELQNENFILHEKYNELLNKYEKLSIEKEKLEKVPTSENITFNLSSNISNMKSFKQKEINQITTQTNTINIFDQLMIEREMTIQDNIIKSYSREMDKLRNDIKLLKNINNVKNIPKNDIKEKPVLKESAEEKIKLLGKLILENNLVQDLENEFNLYDVAKEGEIDIDLFIRVIQNLNIKFEKYDLIEIFNNFNRTQDNKIRFLDLLNSLISKHPSSYFIQPDPSYLKELECKILNYEKKMKQMEIELFIKEINDNEVIKRNKELEKKSEELITKITQLEEEKNNNQNVLNQVLKNNFLSGQPVNVNNNESLKKLKYKIEALENQNINNLKEFENKVKEYESKFDNLNLKINKPANIDEYKIKINELENENLNLKHKLKENEILYTNDKNKLIDKLTKYKKNYNSLLAKYDKCEKDKEKIIKLKNINPVQLSNLLRYDEIETMNKKLEDLERRYKDREEHYVKLCNNANIQQVNKEIENISKKFDEERKHYSIIITQKNNELIQIKKEFEEIYKELEELKYNKKLR